MTPKLNQWLFYGLILIQLQLDLLLFSFGFQSLFATILFLFIYPKKTYFGKNSFALTAFFVAKFITASCLIGLESALILGIWLICQILKSNLIFKNLIFYPVLILYLFLSSWLANHYIFKIIFTGTDLAWPLILNLLAGTVLVKILKKILEN